MSTWAKCPDCREDFLASDDALAGWDRREQSLLLCSRCCADKQLDDDDDLEYKAIGEFYRGEYIFKCFNCEVRLLLPERNPVGIILCNVCEYAEYRCFDCGEPTTINNWGDDYVQCRECADEN